MNTVLADGTCFIDQLLTGLTVLETKPEIIKLRIQTENIIPKIN
ncbi:hypothetical protein [Paenibacillus endoradicis]|nr:hypothetical protein [Paenibacillus endoradicis]MCR8655834.1 hypothetical protein [Paenibacillus endoradicis]MCR8658160.1 hypothetical protein [Paenibacillus endoradicis]